ncbi:MAG: class I SAM-dependent methyltransferase [Bacteroidia bacterium]|nr:class I SAM-dependent methyltransferase [Bacteroidia bacterium]
MELFTKQEENVSAAFTAQSPIFDKQTTGNPMEVYYRDRSRRQVMEYAKRGESMLELNCGTGLDAIYFAEQGLTVLATDNSDGMLKEFAAKLQTQHKQLSLSMKKCSFNALDANLGNQKFDHVFSNYGGLNCADDLSEVIRQVNNQVKPGGMVHFVMIAPVCFWEWITIFKGKFQYAFRRLTKRGVRSHLEGHYFETYYYSSSYIAKAFGKNYKIRKLRSLGFFTPPTFNHYFPSRHPTVFKILNKLELAFDTVWPFNRSGDLFIISLQKKG